MRKCSFLIPIVSFHKMWQIVSLAGTWSHCNTPVQSRKTTLHYNLQFTWLIYYYITYILICTLVFHSWLTAYIICDIYESVLVFHLDDNDESQLRYVTVIKWVVLCGLSRRVEVLKLGIKLGTRRAVRRVHGGVLWLAKTLIWP